MRRKKTKQSLPTSLKALFAAAVIGTGAMMFGNDATPDFDFETKNNMISAEVAMISQNVSQRYIPGTNDQIIVQEMDDETDLVCTYNMKAAKSIDCDPMDDIRDNISPEFFASMIEAVDRNLTHKNVDQYEQISPYVVRRTIKNGLVRDYDFGANMLLVYNGDQTAVEQIPFLKLPEDGQDHVATVQNKYWKNQPKIPDNYDMDLKNILNFDL